MYLRDAEHSDWNSRGPRMHKAITPGTEKRRRESTPPDELDDQDEHRFQVDEDWAEECAERDDSSYHGGLGSAG